MFEMMSSEDEPRQAEGYLEYFSVEYYAFVSGPPKHYCAAHAVLVAEEHDDDHCMEGEVVVVTEVVVW